MDRKMNKRVIVTIVLIGAFFMIGTGIKTAHAGDLGTSAYYAAMSGLYQGRGELDIGLGLYYGDSAYLLSAYENLAAAYEYAYYAYVYASYASGEYAYYAYVYATAAYDCFATALDFAYYAYSYNDASYAYVSMMYGGAGASAIAISEYYGGIGSYGGDY